MNKLALLLSACLAGCAFTPNTAPWSGVIDELDPRSAKVLEMCAGYCNNDTSSWEKHFAADAVLHVNDSDFGLAEVTATFRAGHEVFDDIRHADVVCTTMRYNNGETYTNYWYTWHGTVRATGDHVTLKGYAWFRWGGDQVVESYNAFDPTQYNQLAAGTSAEIK